MRAITWATCLVTTVGLACSTESTAPGSKNDTGDDVESDGSSDVEAPSDDSADGAGDDDTSDSTVPPEDVPSSGDTSTDPDIAPDVAPGPWTAVIADVGTSAKSLSMGDRYIVWEEAGAIRIYDRETAAVSTVLSADGPGAHRDPALAGVDHNQIVFSDNRNGDWDLFILDIADGSATPLVVAENDQTAPSADGPIVAWVDTVATKGDATSAEIWAMDLETNMPRALTADDAEQTFPHVHGRRVVFADYIRDPDKQVLGDPDHPDDPNLDNSDITAVDLPVDLVSPLVSITVTDNTSKQSRPAVHEDRVVWLDWRGISPEPKYKQFKVFARTLGQPEVLLGVTGWTRPALWQRPAIDATHIAYVIEVNAETGLPQALGEAVVMIGTLDGTAPQPLEPSVGDLIGVTLHGGGVGWLGGGRLGVTPLP